MWAWLAACYTRRARKSVNHWLEGNLDLSTSLLTKMGLQRSKSACRARPWNWVSRWSVTNSSRLGKYQKCWVLCEIRLQFWGMPSVCSHLPKAFDTWSILQKGSHWPAAYSNCRYLDSMFICDCCLSFIELFLNLSGWKCSNHYCILFQWNRCGLLCEEIIRRHLQHARGMFRYSLGCQGRSDSFTWPVLSC